MKEKVVGMTEIMVAVMDNAVMDWYVMPMGGMPFNVENVHRVTVILHVYCILITMFLSNLFRFPTKNNFLLHSMHR